MALRIFEAGKKPPTVVARRPGGSRGQVRFSNSCASFRYGSRLPEDCRITA
jgi:hypothetical protein